MPVSAEDIATAKEAYGEMARRDAGRAFSIIYGGMLLVPATLSFLIHQGGPLQVWDAITSAFRIGGVLWMFLAVQIVNYVRFQARYAGNLKVVTELELKYAGELRYGLKQEVQNASKKKALLWRLDAFFRRKKTVE